MTKRSAKLLTLTALLGTMMFVPASMAQQRGALTYLQKEPMTLFDAGMKSLRRLALDGAEKVSVASGLPTTSRVSYKDSEARITIAFEFTVKATETPEKMRKDCAEYRRKSILRMFRIGRSDYGFELSVSERIRRRIGGQFAHEPTISMTETIALGEQLGNLTYFQVTLATDGEPAFTVTCQGLAHDLMLK